jgi:hypothetical protein
MPKAENWGRAEGGKLGKSRRRKIGEEMITNIIEIVD